MLWWALLWVFVSFSLDNFFPFWLLSQHLRKKIQLEFHCTVVVFYLKCVVHAVLSKMTVCSQKKYHKIWMTFTFLCFSLSPFKVMTLCWLPTHLDRFLFQCTSMFAKGSSVSVFTYLIFWDGVWFGHSLLYNKKPLKDHVKHQLFIAFPHHPSP